MSRTYKAINRAVGKAIHDYEMIADGDRIAVGLSGGADSLTLMWFLNERLSRIPVRYELFAVYVDPGFDGGFDGLLRRYCEETGYQLRIEYTDYGVLSHSEANRENPCFLCSRLRRKRLFEVADELGCRKLALGHNRDDIIDLNMCYAGEISSMLPSQDFFGGRFTVIRPLAYTDEAVIRQFAEEQEFPGFVNTCPSAGHSKRQEIKMVLNQLYSTNPKVKGNIFRAMSHVRPDYLPKPVKGLKKR